MSANSGHDVGGRLVAESAVSWLPVRPVVCVIFLALSVSVFASGVSAQDSPEIDLSNIFGSSGDTKSPPKQPEANTEEPESYDSLPRVSRYQLTRRVNNRETPLEMQAKPLMRFANPVFATSGGALYLWTRDKRPAAALRTYVNRKNEHFESFRSLCDAPLVARRFEGGPIVWSPLRPAEAMRIVPDEKQALPSVSARLIQMRRIQRRFQVRADLINAGGVHVLRQLPTPLYRYSNDEVIDGAIFAFTHGTAPGVLIILEARESEEGGARWYYRVAAVALWRIEVDYNNKSVWSEERRTAQLTGTTDLFDCQMLSAADIRL